MSVKDLGIKMTSNCSFNEHIGSIVEKAKRMASWVLRTFNTRDKTPMLALYKALIRPLLEYSSPLWTPIKKSEIQALEAIQKSFLLKIREVNKDYALALKELKMYSLETRPMRYQAIHIYKILKGIIPNIKRSQGAGIRIQTDTEHRRGRTCSTFDLRKTPSHLNKVRKQSFRCQGVDAFNALPKPIRNISNTNVATFKSALDQHLRRKFGFCLESDIQSGRQAHKQRFSRILEQDTPRDSNHPLSGATCSLPTGPTLCVRTTTQVANI